MRIISKFRDYYDHAAGMGIDKTLIYKRSETRIELQKNEEFPTYINDMFKTMASPYRFRNNNCFTFNEYVLGFCGKFYPFLNLKTDAFTTPTSNNLERDNYLHSETAIRAFLNNKRFGPMYTDWTKRYSSKELCDSWNPLFCAQQYNKVFSQCPEHDEEFHAFNTPIILYAISDREWSKSKNRWTTDKWMKLNPDLSKLNFVTVIDPYTAFQEIAMYMSGVIGCRENDMIQISDTDMRDAKGFYDMSFKKHPTKKR